MFELKPNSQSRRNLLRTGSVIVGAAVLGFGGVMRAISPGVPELLLDAAGRPIAGSLSEKVFVEINGTRQGMIIQSTDVTHPDRKSVV